MTMVVGVYESLTSAQHAVADLMRCGYARDNISVLVRNLGMPAVPGTDGEEHGPLSRATNSVAATRVLAGGPLGAALRTSNDEPTEDAVTHTLVSAGLNLPVARSFAEAICNGAVLVAVHCQERRIRDAREILDTHNESDEVAGVRLR